MKRSTVLRSHGNELYTRMCGLVGSFGGYWRSDIIIAHMLCKA